MPGSGAFETVCEALETTTPLDRLESRGTVRLALKQAGFEPRSITAEQMAVVVERVLPPELAARGVRRADVFCALALEQLEPLASEPSPETPDDVFARLAARRDPLG